MPEVQNPGLGTGQQAMLVNTTTLTPAQLRASFSTPAIVVPAPGAGKVILPFLIAGVYHFGTSTYMPVTADSPQFFYSSAVISVGIALGSPFLSTSSDKICWGSGFITVPAPQLSQLANQPLVLTNGGDLNEGSIATATLGAGGAGYAPNDTGTITTGSGDATYQVLTVGGGGAVLTFSITGAGTSYATANGVATAVGGAQPGVGAGFTVNITAVTQGDGTLKVTTYYQILPVP